MLNLNTPLSKSSVAVEPVWKVNSQGLHCTWLHTAPFELADATCHMIIWTRPLNCDTPLAGLNLWQEWLWYHLSSVDGEGAPRTRRHSSHVSRSPQLNKLTIIYGAVIEWRLQLHQKWDQFFKLEYCTVQICLGLWTLFSPWTEMLLIVNTTV